MFTTRVLLSSIVLALGLFGCEDEDSSPLPGDAGEQERPGPDGPDGPFGSGSDDDPSDDEPRDDDNDDEPEPQGDVQPLPAAIPPELPETVACDGLNCRDALVGDILVPPCCPAALSGSAEPSCGLDIQPVTAFMPLQAGCFALEQPGNRDTSCPDVFFNDPTELRDLPGCCMPEGRCGVVANLSLLADFGCVDPRTLLLGAPSEELQSCTPEIPEPEPEPEPATGDGGMPMSVGDGGESTDAGMQSVEDASADVAAEDVEDASAPADGGR